MEFLKHAYCAEMHEICVIREESSHILEMFEVNDEQSEDSATELVRSLNRGEATLQELISLGLIHRNAATAYCPNGASFPAGARF